MTLTHYHDMKLCVSKELFIYTSSRQGITLALIGSPVSGHMIDAQSPFSCVFFSLPTHEKHMWLFNCLMLHYVRQTLLFSAGKMVHRGVIRDKKLACCKIRLMSAK